MLVSEALARLGSTRIIWIDDCFSETPRQFANLLIGNLEIAKNCNFEELQSVFSLYDFDPELAEAELVQKLSDLNSNRVSEMKEIFFAEEKKQQQAPANELSKTSRDIICTLLGIRPTDCWTFEDADSQLAEICARGDEELSYIVDLNNAGGSATRGLEILIKLWESNSSGTAFILTHETTADREGEKESELLAQISAQMRHNDGVGLPLCVIAKERLQPEDGDEEVIKNSLKIAVKRAGLRRSMYEVLRKAKDRLESAYREAVEKLMLVPPEQLEAHIVERGRKEGVSELHVVERAITAHIGQQVRVFFGTDDSVRRSTLRLRALQGIRLESPVISSSSVLAPFRKAEVWEDEQLLNRSLTPLTCGDIFETDADEVATRTANKRFLLLGQPCDLALRADGKRDSLTGFFVPLKKKPRTRDNASNPKAPFLPFLLDGEDWVCDFRATTPVNLAILDLATFRKDGRVRVDDNQAAPEELLPGLSEIYSSRISQATQVLSAGQRLGVGGLISPSLQLTFSTSGPFKLIFTATFEPASPSRIDEGVVRSEMPKRVTWRLRRSGRIRMPYAAALLDQYVSVMSRHAFDLDYMNPGTSDPPNPIQ